MRCQLKSSVARCRPAAPYSRARSGSLTTSVSTRARSADVALGVDRRPGAVLHLLDRDEPPGDAVDDDLRDAAGRRADDGRTARHRLQVHDAQRLVHGRADERRGRAEDGAQLVARQHPIEPDDAGAGVLQSAHEALDLGHDLGRVGRAGGEDHLHVGRQSLRGAEEVRQALLPGDAADEHHRGPRRVDAQLGQQRRILDRVPRLDVDAVVDDAHPRRDRAPGSCAGCRRACRC